MPLMLADSPAVSSGKSSAVAAVAGLLILKRRLAACDALGCVSGSPKLAL